MTAILNRYAMGILMIFASAALSSCGTVTPDPIKDDQASYDSTTPKAYDSFNSGLVDVVLKADGTTDFLVVTSGWTVRYDNLIKKYREQFYQSDAVKISEGDGVKSYKDKNGYDLFQVDPQHYGYFLRLNRWNKQGKPEDSIWMKAKGLTH